MGKSGCRVALFLVFLCNPLFSPDISAETYSYTDIHPPGWTESRVLCLNSRNEAAGFGMTVSGERGFVWSSGKITEILPPGADDARALWINDAGEIAGFFVKDGIRHAFLLRDGVYIDPAPGWIYSEATYVGDDGTVGGTGEFGAFVSRNGSTEILPGFSIVVAGNSSGELVGNTDNTARLYLPGLGYRNLTPPGTVFSIPRGINENGRVALNSLQSGIERGYVFSDPFFVSMTPPGWASSHATAINNREMVAGYGDSPEGRRSFLRSGATYEILAFPGWLATEAEAVNELGQAAGAGTTASGETHAFLASPAGHSAAASPEPGASGGCSIAPGGALPGPGLPTAVDGILAWIPVLILFFRRVPTGRRTGACHSPMIFTRTRFLRRPSNSP